MEGRLLDQSAANGSTGEAGLAPGGPPALAPRRASWAEGRLLSGQEPGQTRAEAEAAFAAFRASSANGTSSVGVGMGGGEGVGGGGERARGKGVDLVRVGGEGRVAVSPRREGGTNGNVERRAYEDAGGGVVVEESLPIEDRLQAVMKDLGVPLEACAQPGDRGLARDRREKLLAAAAAVGGGVAVSHRSTSTTELTAGAARMGEAVIVTAETGRVGVPSRVDRRSVSGVCGEVSDDGMEP